MMSGIVLSFFLLTVFSLARSHIEDDFANQNRLRSQNLKADEIPEAVEQHDEDFSRRWKALYEDYLADFDRDRYGLDDQNRPRPEALNVGGHPEDVDKHAEDFNRRWKAQFDKHLEEFDRYFKHLGHQNRIHPEALKIAGQVDDVLKVPLDGAEGQVSLTMAFLVGKLRIHCYQKQMKRVAAC